MKKYRQPNEVVGQEAFKDVFSLIVKTLITIGLLYIVVYMTHDAFNSNLKNAFATSLILGMFFNILKR